MRLTKIAGALYLVFGVGHLGPALLGTRAFWLQTARSGWWNQVPPPWELENVEGQRNFWATVGSAGAPSILIGLMILDLVRRNVSVSPFVGWATLAYALIASTVAPVGGFWMLLVPGAILVFVSARARAKLET